MRKSSYLILLVIAASFWSCSSYYERNRQFQALIYQDKFAEASDLLAKSKKAKKKRNRVLYLLERGYALYRDGKYLESSKLFIEADYLIEDYKKQIGYEALSLFINPSVKPYKTEDFEQVMLNYINALNFLKLKDYESALVECRRINLKLIATAERYKEKPKYKEDAFAHLLMGSIYETTGDLNNAFIAYRNAYEVYKRDYVPFFEMPIPVQLKKDVFNMALANGFKSDIEYFEKEFGMTPKDIQKSESELIIFWNNGFSPYKEQFSIDFTILRSGNFITFVNPTLGYNFSFPASSVSQQDASNLSALRVVRIAFPRYVHRPLIYNRAEVSLSDKNYGFEMVENLDAIAFKSLNDRFGREMANALLRFAIKKATEMALRKENKDAAAILSIANAISEQADTRNWQTLPNTVSYTRIPLNIGENKIIFKAFKNGNQGSYSDTLQVIALKGRKYIRVVNTTK
jgi:uncharacterized protein